MGVMPHDAGLTIEILAALDFKVEQVVAETEATTADQVLLGFTVRL